MAIKWGLKKYLAVEHGIYKSTELKKLISEKTGVIVSHSNLCRYTNGIPKSLRLETIHLLCTALECRLADFCEITPKTVKKAKVKKKKLSPQNTPAKHIGTKCFPDPADYER